MYRNSSRLIFPVLFLITSCVMDIESPSEISLNIEWIAIEYNQIENKLFMQLEIMQGNENIDSVYVDVHSGNYDSTFILNDNGVFGDLIAQNNRFSIITEVLLPFEEYQFSAIVFTSSSKEYIKNATKKIEEEFPPEIVDIIFWQKNADGLGSIFDPNSEAFLVDSEDYSFLDIQLIINDANGLDDLRYVRYQINVEAMMAEDSCQYLPESGFLSYPQWYLEYKETIEAGFVFDVNNIYLAEPGIPIKPIGLCGRIGVSSFRFIVSDMTFEPVIEERSIGFDN